MAKSSKTIFLSEKTLKAWLAKDQWEPRQLINWLQGYDFSPVGHDDEPFRWILRWLPTGAGAKPARKTLAKRLAALLEQEPDVHRPGDRPEELLYNLLILCANLECSKQLQNPLLAILQRRQLSGQWLGIDLRYALQDALIKNQMNADLLPLWKLMSEGKKHNFLPGDEFDGFDGARSIPGGLAAPDAPALDVIGRALKGIADKLEREPTRGEKFRILIARAKQSCPSRPTWDKDLLKQADRHQWPGWAVDRLDLYLPVAVLPAGGERALLWHQIAECMRATYKHRELKTFCNDRVVEVEMSKEASTFVRQIAPIFEEERINNPFTSDRATIGIITNALLESEASALERGDLIAAATLVSVRVELLKQKGVADIRVPN